jgi:hypothetical protein
MHIYVHIYVSHIYLLYAMLNYIFHILIEYPIISREVTICAHQVLTNDPNRTIHLPYNNQAFYFQAS